MEPLHFPHIGPPNTSEFSTTAHVVAPQANQNHPFFVEQRAFSPGLKEIRLWGYESRKEQKASHPHSSTSSVPFTTVKVINPLTATKGRTGQAVE